VNCWTPETATATPNWSFHAAALATRLAPGEASRADLERLATPDVAFPSGSQGRAKREVSQARASVADDALRPRVLVDPGRSEDLRYYVSHPALVPVRRHLTSSLEPRSAARKVLNHTNTVVSTV
jgi:hypothetical protein